MLQTALADVSWVRRKSSLFSPCRFSTRILRHVAELSFRELADSLGIGLSAAKMRLHRAEQRLRTRVGSTESSAPTPKESWQQDVSTTACLATLTPALTASSALKAHRRFRQPIIASLVDHASAYLTECRRLLLERRKYTRG